jgi:hypothetical protein
MNDNEDRRLENAAKKISKALNLIESARIDVDGVYGEHDEWDCSLLTQIDNCAMNLGFSLATVTNLMDED